MAGSVMANDVAARDVQAATSLANRIATAKQSLRALRAAALGPGASRSGKVRVLDWRFPMGNQSAVITGGMSCL